MVVQMLGQPRGCALLRGDGRDCRPTTHTSSTQAAVSLCPPPRTPPVPRRPPPPAALRPPQMATRLRAGGHRLIIFSQFTRMLDLLEEWLQVGRGAVAGACRGSSSSLASIHACTNTTIIMRVP